MNQRRSRNTAPAPAAPPQTAAVVLSPQARPGVLRVGPYVPGQVYTLPLPQAARLVRAKGFAPATEEDAAALRALASPLNAAAPSGAATPSYADGQGGGTHSRSQE